MRQSRVWIVGGLLMWMGGISRLAHAENVKFIRESDFVMSQDEALKFSAEVISPILIGFANSSEGPEALRLRILAFIQMTKSHEINYVPVPAYYPDRALHVVAKVQPVQSERLLLAFIPELMQWRSRLSESDFRYALLVGFAHEMIHVELGQDKHSEKQAVKDEAIAWGKTVLEIIRPLEAQGLIAVPEYKTISNRLKAFNDNYEDSRWVNSFRLH